MPLFTPILMAAAAALTAAGPDDATVSLKLIPKDGMKKIGYYAPQRVTLSNSRPDSIKKLPEGLAAPRFGTLSMTGDANQSYAIILDEPEGKPAKLLVDSNGNGDLTDDPAAEWEGKAAGGPADKPFTQYNGGAMIDLGKPDSPRQVHVSMYRFDPSDPQRAGLKDVLLFYRDYAAEGELTLGGKTYPILLTDELASGDFRGKPIDPTPADQTADDDKPAPSSGVKLLIDVNNNGKFESRGEAYDVRLPFNIGGTTYQIMDLSRDGLSFKVAKSDKTVAEIPPPPDHGVGKVITAFDDKTTDDKPVHFPADFKGKVVLLDFWATWCGPCMHEMPNVVATYGEFHDKGFEILGISLDNAKSIERMPSVMEKAGMTWRQVADGKGWKARIAQMYVVNSIPATFLVDGDSGKVLGVNLRGEKLKDAVEKALKDRTAN